MGLLSWAALTRRVSWSPQYCTPRFKIYLFLFLRGLSSLLLGSVIPHRSAPCLHLQPRPPSDPHHCCTPLLGKTFSSLQPGNVGIPKNLTQCAGFKAQVTQDSPCFQKKFQTPWLGIQSPESCSLGIFTFPRFPDAHPVLWSPLACASAACLL